MAKATGTCIAERNSQEQKDRLLRATACADASYEHVVLLLLALKTIKHIAVPGMQVPALQAFFGTMTIGRLQSDGQGASLQAEITSHMGGGGGDEGGGITDTY